MTWTNLTRVLGVLLAVPAVATAQAACNIELGKPGQVKDANSALAKTTLFAGKPDQMFGAVKEAMTKLAKDEAKVIAANPVGRAFIMGNAFAELASMPEGKAPVPRANVGLMGEGTIDLLVAADSMYDVVEASNAACKEQTEEGRRKVYAALVNEAVNAYNGQKIDEAMELSQRGLIIYDGFKLAYIAHNLMGNALQSKDDMDGAVNSFMKMTELMKGDTALVEDRRNTMTNVAMLMLSHAEGLEGERKTAKVKQAIEYLGKYNAEFPGDAKAEATLARAQIMTGDAGAAQKVFADMIANADKYSDAALLDAGVNAARAEQSKEAAALFEAGLKKNPYSRDGLFNVALTLQKMERFGDAEAYIRRLIAIDPENPEAYQVLALNYQSTAKVHKVKVDSLRKIALDAANDKKTTMAQKNAKASEVKALLDPVEALYKADNDSLLSAFTRYQNAKAKMSFNLWSHDGAKHVLAGQVDNLQEAAADYTVVFEFMDAAGNVKGTKEAALAGIAAKGSKAFRVEIEGDGIVAFRYKPFSGS